MKQGLLTVTALVAVFLFPWPLAAATALLAALWVPLLPLAVGLLADTLYYAPGAHWFPYFALAGLGVTLLSLFVRTRLTAGIIA